MMGMPLSVVVEGLVCVLLMITIGYAVVLNSRLKRLQADRDAMKTIVADLIQATDKANASIVELRQTATETDLALSSKLDEADRFAIELANHITAGQAVMDRIAKILAVAREREKVAATPPAVNRAQEALRRLKSREIEKGEAA